MIMTSYDPETDSLYVRFAPAGAQSTRKAQVSPRVTLDYDQDSRLIAVEVLDVRQRLSDEQARPPVCAGQGPAPKDWRLGTGGKAATRAVKHGQRAE